MRCLGRLEPVARPSLAIECRELQMPGREHPEFQEAEIARNWPGQLEHYRKSFEGGSYETWFGEHSYLTARAGEITERESLDILNRLKHDPHRP